MFVVRVAKKWSPQGHLFHASENLLCVAFIPTSHHFGLLVAIVALSPVTSIANFSSANLTATQQRLNQHDLAAAFISLR